MTTFRSSAKKRAVHAALADFHCRQAERAERRRRYAEFIASGDLPVWRPERRPIEATFETPRSHGVHGEFRRAT